MKTIERFALRPAEKPPHAWALRMQYRWYLHCKWTIGRFAIARVRKWERQPISTRKQQLGIALCLLLMLWALSLAFSHQWNLVQAGQVHHLDHTRSTALTHNRPIRTVRSNNTHQVEKGDKNNHGAQPGKTKD
ncbi:hypothetical protein GCM10023189_40660 [Nibrella saemangeumensis]|uniref:Uncharacterized protein n=1 Tax=Nibrella saemangeumensis TaxID=1084526 RepID=A0ABP8N8A6_9BACT